MGARGSIITILRTGGEYKEKHVERLRLQCADHAPGVPFRCLSDIDGSLRHNWPGWWSKIEAFRVRGPVLYLDLDTTICGDLEPLLRCREHFVTLRDFNFPARNVQSSVMFWSGDMSALYDRFRADPEKHMAENSTPRWWGDQGFIERVARPAYWQDIAPGAFVSWKKHCQRGVPRGARVVVFHGKPRPWEVK